MNQSMREEMETLFLLSRPEYSHISSSVVREIIRNGGDIAPFVPEAVLGMLS